MGAPHRGTTGKSCPGVETIGAYIDGALDAGGRQRLEAHAAACADCRMLLADASRLVTELGVAAPAPSRAAAARAVSARVSWWTVGGLAAAAALLFAVVWVWQSLDAGPPREQQRRELAELVAAVGPRRPFEARLTGGFPYGPLAVVARGASEPAGAPAAVRAAAARLEQAVRDRPTPRAGAALASAELVLGRADAAVALFEEAARQLPGAADVWSDLAAAHLVRASRTGDRAAATAALEAADRALALSPFSSEALYNRALALEVLGRLPEARQAWERCAAREPDVQWADDARRRARAPGR